MIYHLLVLMLLVGVVAAAEVAMEMRSNEGTVSQYTLYPLCSIFLQGWQRRTASD